MPATATEATRVQAARPGADPEPRVPEDRDPEALDWFGIVRLLTATDEDDVPLFGRLPA